MDPSADLSAPLASPSVSLAAPRAEEAASSTAAWVEAKRGWVRIARIAMREEERRAIIAREYVMGAEWVKGEGARWHERWCYKWRSLLRMLVTHTDTCDSRFPPFQPFFFETANCVGERCNKERKSSRGRTYLAALDSELPWSCGRS